jgi:hypothetical protein
MTGEDGIIFEFRRVGAFVKASAVDVASAVEVSITGPANADEATLRQAARRKLEWALARRRAGGGANDAPEDGPAGGGTLA